MCTYTSLKDTKMYCYMQQPEIKKELVLEVKIEEDAETKVKIEPVEEPLEETREKMMRVNQKSERVLRKATNQPTTFVSIDFLNMPRQFSSPPICVKRLSSIVHRPKGKFKKIYTNFETEHGIVRKERVYPISTPTNLESITLGRPQNIRSLPPK